jgi:hypothetical protein
MTEAEWLAGTDALELAEELGQHPSRRKWCLLSVACWRRMPRHLLEEPETKQIVEMNEKAADAPDSPEVLEFGVDMLILHYLDAHDHALTGWVGEPPEEFPRENAARAILIRDVFGNPFRPIALDHECLNPTVRHLAEAIYKGRDPDSGYLDADRLPILADALEDAGCTNADILAHCRGPGPHVRGCWVVDLLLGKE